MANVLIVDDNDNHRFVLRSILEMYASEHADLSLSVHEAANGTEAIRMCKETEYSLIFMDILMPGLSGIETTKHIRMFDRKVMIVAVSAIDDADRQKEILQNGAEDYIDKPINIDIFNARLSNYFNLIAARNHKPSFRSTHNLFNPKIYAKKTFFSIDSMNDLAEFWEHYLFNSQLACESLSDTVRFFYTLGSFAVKFNMHLSIWIEESDNDLYFTMEGLQELDPKYTRIVLMKNPLLAFYEITENAVSVRFETKKNKLADNDLIHTISNETVSQRPEPEMISPNIPMKTAVSSLVEMTIFHYMDHEDLEDVKDYITKLNFLLLIVGNDDIQIEEIEEIALHLERIGKTCSVYSQSFLIGRALSILSQIIRGNIKMFIEKSTSLGTLCASFSRDLMYWVRMMFEEGAPSVNFMDDTIISNAEMLGSMLEISNTSDNSLELDDIFNF